MDLLQPIQGLAVSEVLSTGRFGVLMRGSREGKPALVRLLQGDYPSAEELARLRYGYELSASLDLRCIAQVLDLVKLGNDMALVMEDAGGRPLHDLLKQGVLPLTEAVEMALRLARALGELHRQHVIHKDVNPFNILVHPRTREVWLANFDIASRLSSESAELSTHEKRLEGSLAYVSPEQTGRMNRSVDYRTDFYSLGITLYEMLTGQVPFHGQDAMALVYSHLAIEPPAPHQVRPEVPRPLSAVVMKLLAKNADERYQSAYGLAVDLELCLEQLGATGTIADFSLGQRDMSATFRVPQRLYGREREVAQLLEAFERVGRGERAELLLVSGYSGVGKSSLVNEVQRPLVQRGGYFGAGKFDQVQNAPYAAWSQAFEQVLRQLLVEREDQVESWRMRLKEVLGPNGRLMTDIIPHLETLIGPQPAVPALGPTESQNRFNLVFQHFISAFSRPEHPLVLFLDDLQWVDAASLRLLQLILSDTGCRHLLLIGAYRDNEVLTGHGLLATLAELRKATTSITEVSLQPLSLGDLQRLLTDMLGQQQASQLEELAALVHQKTQGNLFFANQFLTSLHARELLTFDPALGRWRWSIEQIQRQGITDNLAVLMVERLSSLPAATQEALKRAACIGSRFDLHTISIISESSLKQVSATLWPAVQLGLLVPLGEGYKYFQSERSEPTPVAPSEVRYEFLHDRVREAAYSLMSTEARKQLHLRIGRLLLESIAEEQREAAIFELVNQLNQALELIDQPQERDVLARLNLQAGLRARMSSAYTAALEYLQVGTRLLSEDCWERLYEVTWALHRHRAECFYLLGNFGEADQDLELMQQRARSGLELQEIYVLKLDLYLSRGKYLEAIGPARQGLRLLGIELPEEPDKLAAAIARESEKLQAHLAHRTPSSLLGLPRSEDALEHRRIVLLSRTAIYAGWLLPETFNLIVLITMNRSLEHGLAPGSATGYSNHAVNLVVGKGDLAGAYEFGRLAVTLSERYDGPVDRMLTEFMFAIFLNPWSRPVESSARKVDQLFQVCLELGTLFWAGLCSAQMAFLGHFTGEELSRQWERTQRHLDFYRRDEAQHRQALYPLGAVQYALLRLMHPRPPETDAPWHQESLLKERLDNPFFLAAHLISCLRLSYLMEEHARAHQYGVEAARLLSAIRGWYPLAEYFFFQALVLAALHPLATEEEQARYEREMDETLERLQGWSAHYPENFRGKHRLLAAERARVAGRHAEALTLYDEAIDAAASSGHLHEEALANELAARFHLSRGRRRMARACLRDAVYGYTRWGAHAKVAQLERKYPELLRAEARAEELPTRGASLDLVAVLRASQALSEEIVLQELLRKLMGTILENAGAQRAVLLLKGDSPLVVEAQQREAGGAEVLLRDASREGPVELPGGLVRYVERTRERVVLSEAASEGSFRDEEYVVRQRPRSVLCMPVLKQKTLVGTLYLENNLVAGAFTPGRCQVLDLLASQAAISLENARLYDTLEQRVRERTQALHASNEELSQALQQLRQTQAQLVMQEKLASLGALTAGIAHEIKNPLNFINNFALLSVELTDELAELVEQERGRLGEQSAESLAGVLGDLRESVGKVNEYGRRADGIVRSMVELSRGGGGRLMEVDLNSLVGEFVNLAWRENRSRDPSFHVALETKLDAALQPVEVMPQELGRVILNLVQNALHAVEARRQAAGEAYAPRIEVSTQELGGRVEVRVWDNGTGIPKGIRAHVFNPFFTTKPAGQGTGLGLSISHEIVVQGHGGKLDFSSEEDRFTEFVISLPRRARLATAAS